MSHRCCQWFIDSDELQSLVHIIKTAINRKNDHMIEISLSNHLLILHPKFMEKRWNGKIIQNDISGCCCFLFEINIENSLQVVKFLNFWIANFKMAKKTTLPTKKTDLITNLGPRVQSWIKNWISGMTHNWLRLISANNGFGWIFKVLALSRLLFFLLSIYYLNDDELISKNHVLLIIFKSKNTSLWIRIMIPLKECLIKFFIRSSNLERRSNTLNVILNAI